jgi:hypothetical protein
MDKVNISFFGKLLSLLIVSLILFFTFITSVNSSSLIGRQKLESEKMQDSLKSQYNELITDLGNTTSQSSILNNQRGKMVPINRNNGDLVSLEKMQDEFNKSQAKNNPDSAGGKTVLVK